MKRTMISIETNKRQKIHEITPPTLPLDIMEMIAFYFFGCSEKPWNFLFLSKPIYEILRYHWPYPSEKLVTRMNKLSQQMTFCQFAPGVCWCKYRYVQHLSVAWCRIFSEDKLYKLWVASGQFHNLDFKPWTSHYRSCNMLNSCTNIKSYITRFDNECPNDDSTFVTRVENGNLPITHGLSHLSDEEIIGLVWELYPDEKELIYEGALKGGYFTFVAEHYPKFNEFPVNQAYIWYRFLGDESHSKYTADDLLKILVFDNPIIFDNMDLSKKIKLLSKICSWYCISSVWSQVICKVALEVHTLLKNTSIHGPTCPCESCKETSINKVAVEAHTDLNKLDQ